MADLQQTSLRIDPSLHAFTPDFDFGLRPLIEVMNDEYGSGITLNQQKMSVLHKLFSKFSIPNRCSFIEADMRFSDVPLHCPESSCFYGYFQSWKYLDLLSDSRRFQVRSSLHKLSSIEVPLQQKDIVVHVRRGDYLRPGVREIHGVLDFAYYFDAITIMRSKGFSGRILLVSNEKLPDFDRFNESFRGACLPVYGNTVWHDLSLLAKAPSLVLANSTFSYMGAWLGREVRPTIAPDPWYASDAIDDSDFIPSDWIRVQHRFF